MATERVEWVREQLNELKQRKRSENVTYVVKGIIRSKLCFGRSDELVRARVCGCGCNVLCTL